jgi:hypothetical protein
VPAIRNLLARLRHPPAVAVPHACADALDRTSRSSRPVNLPRVLAVDGDWAMANLSPRITEHFPNMILGIPNSARSLLKAQLPALGHEN